jgi:hypothetical protein
MMETKVDKREDAVKMFDGELGNKHDGMVPAKPILNYLIAKAKEDEEFADRVMLEEKTVKECFQYVMQEVKKALNSKNGYLADQVVYDMATDYFTLDGELIEKAPEPPKIDTSRQAFTPPTPKKEEKKPQISLFEM